MLSVGLEDQRMRALADAQQIPSQPGIEHASAEQQQAARTQVFERQSTSHLWIVSTRMKMAATTIIAPSNPAEKNEMRSYP